MTIGALSAMPQAWQAMAMRNYNQADAPNDATSNTADAMTQTMIGKTGAPAKTMAFADNPDFFQAGMSPSTLGGLLSVQGEGATPPSFSDIDSDGDGSLSQSEFESFGATIQRNNTASKADDLFSQMDSDGDGTVTAAEKDSFDAAMKAGDGKTPPENAAAQSLTSLMQELLTALDAYRSGTSATASAATTTTSIAA